MPDSMEESEIEGGVELFIDKSAGHISEFFVQH